MGSHQNPSAALPIFTLHLESAPEKIFKPDDTIHGYVTLSTPFPLVPQAIEVSLWGLSCVWLRTSSTSNNNSTSYTHWRDNVPLFDVTFNILPQQQQLLPGQSYSFPFQIRVPEGTGKSRQWGYKNDMDATWTVQPHHLPPTFSWGFRPDFPDLASVKYGITARLIRTGIDVGTHAKEALSCTASINFQPLNPNIDAPYSVLRYTDLFKLASSSLAGRDPSSIGLVKKISDRFSSETPTLVFELGLELPDLLVSNSKFKFRTTFNVHSKSENVVQIPPITVKILQLKLIEITLLRAALDRQANSFMSGSHRDGTPTDVPTGSYSGLEKSITRENKTALGAFPESQTLELEEIPLPGEKKGTEQARSAETWFFAGVPRSSPPSFQSFAISRHYRLKAKVGVQIGEKKFDFEAESYVRSMGSAP